MIRGSGVKDWTVRRRPYTDPETGTKSTLYEVMCPHPNHRGDSYRVACYGDEAAAVERARTHGKPPGYG